MTYIITFILGGWFGLFIAALLAVAAWRDNDNN